MNVSLVGMMGSGKSETGKRLAAKLGFAFLDVDGRVESLASQGVDEIFREDGEARFRELEELAIREATSLDNTVISCGGGALTRESNVRALLSSSIVFYLKLSPRRAAQHIGSVRKRPLLEGKDVEKTLAALLEARKTAYEKAHFTVDASGSVGETLARMHSILSSPVSRCAVISGKGVEEASRQIDLVAGQRAAVVELRLDLIDGGEEAIDSLARNCQARGIRFIATCRSVSEGGQFSGDDEEKLGLLERASLAGASFIDVEMREESLLRKVKARIAGRSKLLASFHDFGGKANVSELRSILHRQAGVADAGKIACTIDVVDASSMQSLLLEAQRMRFPLALSPMGEGTLPSRLACGLAGSFFVYASAGKATALGQPEFGLLTHSIDSLRGNG